MNKITKTQFIEFGRMTEAVNLFMRLLADLQAHQQFLQRVGDINLLDDLNNLLSEFISASRVFYLETLEDDVKE